MAVRTAVPLGRSCRRRLILHWADPFAASLGGVEPKALPSGRRRRQLRGKPLDRSDQASPLWTLQCLLFGPDVAAAFADRGENHDPGRQRRRIVCLRRKMREFSLIQSSGPTYRAWPPCSALSRPNLTVAAEARPALTAPARDGGYALRSGRKKACGAVEQTKHDRPEICACILGGD